MHLTPDPWLEKHLPIKVFRVDTTDKANAPCLQPALDAGDAFIHAKVESNDIVPFLVLQHIGFRVIDALVTFELPCESVLQTASIARVSSQIELETARVEHCDAVVHLAQTTIRQSRFHADPLIDNADANRINGAWVKDYFDGKRGDQVDIALLSGRVIGFHAYLTINTDGGRVRVMDLMGVDSEHQNLGVGSAFVQRFIEQTPSTEWARMRVGTQLQNLVAIRLYEKIGFRLVSSHYVLHAHVRGGRLVSMGGTPGNFVD